MADKTGISWTDATWRCYACEVVKVAAEFGRDRSRPHGLSFICRTCKNERARARHVPSILSRRRGWIAPTRDGDKKQARRRINYLVEQGRIPNPNDLPCVDCADEQGFDSKRHEYDHAKGYDGVNQLYVEPVCTPCHHHREEARRG